MHYKNGRSAAVGDWVVGITANSDHKIISGVIVALVPERKKCEVQLVSFPWFGFHIPTPPQHDLSGINLNSVCGVNGVVEGRNDYADVSELIRADDGFRMVEATGRADWRSNTSP